jgi:3-oxoacyl-[acyl-carrier protein] reductase
MVVSGGGTGIGLAVAEAFVRTGDQVVLIGRRKEVLDAAVERLGAGALALPADLADEQEAARVRDLLAERYGRVDVLVNSAGGNVLLCGGDLTTAELWTGNFRANVLTTVLLTEALRGLLADGGRVLLLSSIAAIRGGGSGSYGAAKAALHPYAYDLAADLGPRGITVNVIAPGFGLHGHCLRWRAERRTPADPDRSDPQRPGRGPGGRRLAGALARLTGRRRAYDRPDPPGQRGC